VDADLPTIVVLEDDPHIADLVDLYLREAGYRVTVVSDGERALQQIRARQPRLVVLDVGLPGDKDGIDVCRELRRSSDVPVLMLTARDAELDRMLGFEVGADDYVTKPFSPRELVARVKAILRRAAPGGGVAAGRDQRVLLGGEVELDLVRHEVRRRGAAVGLAAREFDLLGFLAEHRGQALSRQQLLDGVWGEGWVGDERTVDVHVRQLRKKLGKDLGLTTVWGLGYRLD
jgi:DNA-binding response OmpR family regulator